MLYQRSHSGQLMPTPQVQRLSGRFRVPTPQVQRLSSRFRVPTPQVQRLSSRFRVPTPQVQRLSSRFRVPTPQVQRLSGRFRAPLHQVEAPSQVSCATASGPRRGSKPGFVRHVEAPSQVSCANATGPEALNQVSGPEALDHVPCVTVAGSKVTSRVPCGPRVTGLMCVSEATRGHKLAMLTVREDDTSHMSRGGVSMPEWPHPDLRTGCSTRCLSNQSASCPS